MIIMTKIGKKKGVKKVVGPLNKVTSERVLFLQYYEKAYWHRPTCSFLLIQYS